MLREQANTTSTSTKSFCLQVLPIVAKTPNFSLPYAPCQDAPTCSSVVDWSREGQHWEIRAIRQHLVELWDTMQQESSM